MEAKKKPDSGVRVSYLSDSVIISKKTKPTITQSKILKNKSVSSATKNMGVSTVAPAQTKSAALRQGRRVRTVPTRATYMPEVRVRFLIDTLGGSSAVAKLLDVNRSQPGRWSKGEEVPKPETGRVLVDLDHVMARAQMIWAPAVALAWLEGSNAFLDGARPIDVLRLRGSAEVIEALDAALSGAF